MRSAVITEAALRELICEALDSSSNSHLDPQLPVRINPVVDPSAAETDPGNSSFLPKNKAELLSALRVMCDVEDDEDVPVIYIAVKDAIEKQEGDMKKVDVAESVRQAVKKALKDMSLVNENAQSVEEKKLRAQIRKTLKEISYEKQREKGDAVWASLSPVDTAKNPLPPVKKIPAGTSGKSGSLEDQKAKYEKNVSQLQQKFGDLDLKDNEELQTATMFFAESFKDLNFDEAAEAYALAFNEAKETYEEEGVPFTGPGSIAAILTGKLFKDLFEAYSSFDFEEYVTKLGDRARKVISENLEKKKKNVENEKRGYAASDVTYSTLDETAKELDLSIAMIKKIESRALGVLTLGLKAGESLNV